MSQEPPPSDAEPHDEDEVMDPEDPYAFEKCLVGQDLLEEMQLEMVVELKADFEALEEGGGRNSGPRTYL
jgi:hypothetical protein